MDDEKKLLGMLGLCKRAGKLIIGTPMVCEYLSGSRGSHDGVPLVIEASDTSDNTHKKITDKCKFYNVRHIRIEIDAETLGGALGKSAVAAVAVTDKDMCVAVNKKLERIGHKLYGSNTSD